MLTYIMYLHTYITYRVSEYFFNINVQNQIYGSIKKTKKFYRVHSQKCFPNPDTGQRNFTIVYRINFFIIMYHKPQVPHFPKMRIGTISHEAQPKRWDSHKTLSFVMRSAIIMKVIIVYLVGNVVPEEMLDN